MQARISTTCVSSSSVIIVLGHSMSDHPMVATLSRLICLKTWHAGGLRMKMQKFQISSKSDQ